MSEERMAGGPDCSGLSAAMGFLPWSSSVTYSTELRLGALVPDVVASECGISPTVYVDSLPGDVRVLFARQPD